MARALRLERAALLIEDAPGGTFVRRAAHGAVRLRALTRGHEPEDGPWSVLLPIEAGGRQVGLLALARRGAAALAPADALLARRLAAAFASIVEHDRLSADLAHAGELLARADRLSALGTLAAGVAHEIRNPLVSVRTFIQLLPERADDEEFRTGFRELALSEIERICALINDLLAFSRPLPADPEPADLNALARETVRLLDAEARKQGIALRLRAGEGLPAVVVDDRQVRQVLTNVVLNAIEACPPQGRVDVATACEREAGARWCVVTIADSGAGIPPERAARIFEPFFTTKDEGSGLGLFVASRIMSAHGGRIDVEGGAEGGAVFRLRFPVERSGGPDACAG
ncbi:MAG TPA: ATP-binding protein [Candidatus Binatia bacterium]|nr:ATP-binding protein [Candidatus Binatia bacterium]